MKTKHFLTMFLSLGMVFLLSACSSLPVSQENSLSKDEDSVLCTSPSEEGCESCLVINDNDSCVELSWSGSEDSEVDPWYNVNSVISCDSDLPVCANCLKRDKEELETLVANETFQDCDCSEIVLEELIDPCFMPSSCECLCQRFDRLSTACPEL